MEKQTSFSEVEYNGKKRQTRRHLFLNKMETLLKFRHLLEKHHLTRKLFDELKRRLQQQGILMKEGTLSR